MNKTMSVRLACLSRHRAFLTGFRTAARCAARMCSSIRRRVRTTCHVPAAETSFGFLQPHGSSGHRKRTRSSIGHSRTDPSRPGCGKLGASDYAVRWREISSRQMQSLTRRSKRSSSFFANPTRRQSGAGATWSGSTAGFVFTAFRIACESRLVETIGSLKPP